ncbi:glycerophosphodiester phosphodiesterase [Microbacterium invictum]|uniref:Glycerophosphoryl diester phosphodiesterase n=1 Tax=Microbacterium invictum TaxID=515415 RepID=A0AA40SNQ4_9MICO|nr:MULTISPECIES: glycerophosphodiester phosphodiesterase family protein [Microbacterium]MBB4139586.1 glycerophosphoryl diester phosphodiesterase [Microbacterium invictum]
MPDAAASAPRERIYALLIVCVLAVASMLVIALADVAPARATATDMLGQARDPGERAFIAAHRGGGATAPENTLPAIREALRGGFEYVEVDLALSADGHAVLMHDKTVDRTTDGHGRVVDLTLAQLRALDAGRTFAPAYRGTPVPTAEEVLDLLVTEGGRALLDLKGRWDAGAVATLAAQIEVRGLSNRVVAAGFDARTLAALVAQAPELSRMATLKVIPDDIVEAAQQFGVSGVIVDRRALAKRPEVVDELHAAGLRIVVYTLNSDRQWGEVTDLGVDGIVTDDPVMLDDWQRTALGR